jgi:hypothetical protein
MIRMEISNKTLAWLVVAAIVVSIFGTTISLWNLNNEENFAGRLTTNDTGLASVTVSQSVVLRFAVNATNFGTGSINTSGGRYQCNMIINATTNNPAITKDSGCLNFNANTGALILENVGTSFLNVTLNFSANASGFGIVNSSGGDSIGLTALQFAVSNNESGSCTGTLNNRSWSVVPGIPTPQNICTNLSWTVATNSLLIGINVTITENASQGAKSLTFYAQGTNI